MRRRLPALGAPLALALALTSAGARSRADERVVLSPADPPPWRASRIADALREGARDPRELRVETTPPGAALVLAYLRDGAQLALAYGTSPLRAALPSRARAAEGDQILVRAEVGGFAVREVVLDARDAAPTLRVDLERLPSRLLAVSLLELGDWAHLELSSERALEARLAPTANGWRLVLAEVAASEAIAARIDGLRGAAVSRARAETIGRDLIVALERGAGDGRAPRLTRREEPLRGVSHLALEWLPDDRGAATTARAESALADASARLDACAAAFDGELFAALGRATLGRSLAPGRGFADALVALALERLAAQSTDAALELRDRTRFALGAPVARARAATQAAEARGVLFAVRVLAETLAPPGDAQRALRAWLAPEIEEGDFAAALRRAIESESRCRAMP